VLLPAFAVVVDEAHRRLCDDRRVTPERPLEQRRSDFADRLLRQSCDLLSIALDDEAGEPLSRSRRFPRQLFIEESATSTGAGGGVVSPDAQFCCSSPDLGESSSGITSRRESRLCPQPSILDRRGRCFKQASKTRWPGNASRRTRGRSVDRTTCRRRIVFAPLLPHRAIIEPRRAMHLSSLPSRRR